jgi:PEP-CTERM motif
VKLTRALLLFALVFCVAGLAQADSLGGGDGHVVMGGGPPGSPSCNSFQGTTNGAGAIVGGDCTVTGATATTIVFAILDANSNGGLSAESPLTSLFPSKGPMSEFNWTLNCVSGAIDECTLTAPQPPDTIGEKILFGFLDKLNLINDGDCSNDDFIFGIPAGCDITFSTPNQNQLFKGDSKFDVSPNGAPLANLAPEPGTLLLVAGGLLGLPFVRRRTAKR